MAHNIVKKTEAFNKRREDRNQAQKTILMLDTIKNDDYVSGIAQGMKAFHEASKSVGNNGVEPESAKKFKKMLNTSREQLDKVVNGEDGSVDLANPTQKSFENFYGPLIAQSMAAHSQWLLGKTNGLMDYRNISKALSTEGQGIVAMALGTVLQINTGTADEIDTGWVELFEITDALLGKSSAKILNLSAYVRVQEVPEGLPIKTRQPITVNDMEQTTYKRYGIAMSYSTFESELSEFFASAGGVNRLFREFRTSMARTKSIVAYRSITKKPDATYIMDAVDLKDAPDPTNSTFTERLDYKVERFITNLTKAYRTFIKQMKADGVTLGSSRPTIHAVFNPDAAGAGIIESVMNRLNDSTRPIAINANIIFHESMDTPLCGAWEETIEQGKVIKDEDGFDIPKESASEDSFGLMLVLPRSGNIHGINQQLYNISMDYPSNESITYFTFERYTFHASKFQRFWIRNLVPATETETMPLDNGE